MAAQDIIAHDAEVIEGNMGEMRAASTVTHRPDIGRRCFKALVDLHVTAVGGFHSGLSQANTIRVGRATRRGQKMRAFQDGF